MGTYEGGKLKELGSSTTIRDVLIGKIPARRIVGKAAFSTAETVIYLLSSLLLIVFSVMSYLYFDSGLLESVAMFITGSLFIAFYMRHMSHKNCQGK